MKKIVLGAAVLLICSQAFAKKVKFSVDMSAEIVDSNGVHIAGDFQVLAGYTTDWDPGITQLYQEPGDTNIYSLVVDIPAFRHYEFKFVNGIFGYQQEFVPIESRVNYNFLDNRWIYVDSLSNDTMEFGSIIFGGNAPAGKNLLRFYVDMQNETSVSPNGVHVAGSFQGMDPATTRMYSFDGNVYEYIAYIDTGLSSPVEYRYANGNSSSGYETVPGSCANGSGNRDTLSLGHKMLTTVCFSSCVACANVGINENETAGDVLLSPNPASETCTLTFPEAGDYRVLVTDMTGRIVRSFSSNGATNLVMAREGLDDGMYLVRIQNDARENSTVKRLIFSGTK